MARATKSLVVSILLCEVACLLIDARSKLFWNDELFTFHISGLQSFALLRKALQAGTDSMPVSYYMLVRLARTLSGGPQVTLRLPSIVGYGLTLLGVYAFARKRLPAAASLVAILLITLSPFRTYAIEARSYALVVGFFAIAAVLWQRLGETWLFTPLLALFLALAVSFHYYAVVALSAFGFAEIAWTILARRIRWGVWAAFCLATGPFLWGLPTLLGFRKVLGANFWARPGWNMALSTYGFYLKLPPMLVIVLIIFFAIVGGHTFLRMKRAPAEVPLDPNFNLPEIILLGGFLLLPVLLFVLTKLTGGGYQPRYAWPAILGLALGSAYLIRTVWLQPYSTYLLAAMLIAFAARDGGELWTLNKATAGSRWEDRRWDRLLEVCHREPNIPVVIGNPAAYIEAAYYAPPELRDRLVEVVDADLATRFTGTDTLDKANRLLAQMVPLHIENLAAFQAAQQRFLLRSDGGFDWFTPYLVERGYRLKLLSQDSGISLYMAER
jgi:hypothetical protein